MNEISIPVHPKLAPGRRLTLEQSIDALARGDCTEEEFLRATLDARDSSGQSPWDVLAGIDRSYRRGQLAESLFHSINARIGRHAIDDRCDGVTIEMFPLTPPANADLCEPSAEELPQPRPLAPTAAPPTVPDASAPVSTGAEPPPIEEPASEFPPPLPPATALDAPQPIGVGTRLRNRYTLQKLLGRGGMADVFRASDELDVMGDAPRQVAIKILRERLGQRPQLLASLRREFDSTRKLSHPNIVKVHELDRDCDVAFYTMELLDGERLCDLTARVHPRALPRDNAWSVIAAVGAALVHAHSRNVIHGDVSPKNVMVTRSGEVRVLDFGSSRASDLAPSRETSSAGKPVTAVTPAYASCELLEGQPADARDDLYALACLAYELLSGAHPFEGRRATEARRLGLRPKRPPGLRLAQWRALERGLAWAREHRSISIRQWLGSLALEPEPERCIEPGRASSSVRRPRQLPIVLAAVLVIGGLIATAAAWQTRHHPAVNAEVPAGAPGGAPATAPAPGPSDSVEPSGAAESPAPSAPLAPRANAVSPAAPPPGTAEVPGSDRSAVIPARSHPTAVESSPGPKERRPKTALPERSDGDPVISFTAHPYAIKVGRNFAEAHLWRSRATEDGSNFLWWTEDGTARAGVDFVGQNRTPQAFAPGRQFATLFVRLIPQAVRTDRAKFRVCIGKPQAGLAPDDVTCSTIPLPRAPR